GIALLLTGIGFLVFTVRWMREPEATASATPTAPIVPVPA
ncbi:MAG: hypothetical protein QOI80_425, partial [Solirubrobacteraceae bacterium]|nr:hypothetical protein [Solirubrobacteraceae bacterium]